MINWTAGHGVSTIAKVVAALLCLCAAPSPGSSQTAPSPTREAFLAVPTANPKSPAAIAAPTKRDTLFRPSIHGWQFGNSYDLDVDLVIQSWNLDNVGFCGGMCWSALDRFYGGRTIPLTETSIPANGTPLYDELWDSQKDSLPAGTIAKIYSWQQSPDLSHRFNVNHSLGHDTQQEWPKVKEKLDQYKPVTLTLITSSNDANLAHLSDNHRVVAYAYEVRELRDSDWVHGARKAGIRKVTLRIYDPNEAAEDDVTLSFFTGCDDSWIGLRHSEGDEVHGFFLDDKSRSYSTDQTSITIDSCTQTSILSSNRAQYSLTFSWKCPFIPYYSVLINGTAWQHNDLLEDTLAPTGKSFKQCARTDGSLTLQIQLPRNISTVAVRLLEHDDYIDSITIDAAPSVVCRPYVRERADSEKLPIHDNKADDTDVFIKVDRPLAAEVAAVNTSEFRWVFLARKEIPSTTPTVQPFTKTHLTALPTRRLGNVKSPILCDLQEKNLATPIQRSGTLKVMRPGVPDVVTSMPTLAVLAQPVFGGFLPADYDSDTKVEFTYRSRDRFGVVAQSKAIFHGRSIISQVQLIEAAVIDDQWIARMDAAARRLIQLGLLDIALRLPRNPVPPAPPDGAVILDRLSQNQKLKDLIDNTYSAVVSDRNTWPEVTRAVALASKAGPASRVQSTTIVPSRGRGRRIPPPLEADQRSLDAARSGVLAGKTIDLLRGDPEVTKVLRGLWP